MATAKQKDEAQMLRKTKAKTTTRIQAEKSPEMAQASTERKKLREDVRVSWAPVFYPTSDKSEGW